MRDFDFLCESRLKELNPELHRRAMDIGFLVVFLLEKYKNYFPDFTDHTLNHALHVIEFCNRLIGPENIVKMNDEELYVLLMGAYLHDFGMGVSMKDFERFSPEIVPAEFYEKNPGVAERRVIRSFHNEFSGKLIRKYSELLEIPSEELLFAIIQVARGHRKTDLYDEREYPSDWRTPSGNVIRLPYLAALIRLSDEMDIAADRNLKVEYTLDDDIHNRAHEAVRLFEIHDDGFFVFASTREQDVHDEVVSVVGKLQETLDECVDVVERRTPFTISQKKVSLTFEEQ